MDKKEYAMQLLDSIPDCKMGCVVAFLQGVIDRDDVPDPETAVAMEKSENPEKAMCYLIAKKFSDIGCLAVKTESGKALAHLVTYLGLKTLDKGVQILTISDPETYGEYKPYHFVSSEKEFIAKVLNM